MRNGEQGGTGMPDDFNVLARQYWSALGEAMRNAVPGAGQSAGMPQWQQAMDGWSRFAQAGSPAGNDAMARFNAQAQQWFGQMQQVAAQFAGQDAGAGEIAKAWKRVMESAGGQHGGNAFLDLLQGMRGPGLQGFEQWFAQASPGFAGLDAGRNEALSWLRMPAFGVGREQQERWQRLALAQADYQQRTQAYNALMMQATQDAYSVFEGKLAEREEPGRQLHSARALFDLWIDAAEEAYAKVALSQEFREVYGELVNAQMRLRGGIQREVEQACALFGMPTRSELDGAHRKMADMERQLRRLRDAIGNVAPSPKAASTSPRKAGTASKPQPARKAAPAKKTVAASKAVPVKKASSAGKASVAKKATAKRPVAARQAKPAVSKRGSVLAIPQIPMPIKPTAAKRKR